LVHFDTGYHLPLDSKVIISLLSLPEDEKEDEAGMKKKSFFKCLKEIGFNICHCLCKVEKSKECSWVRGEVGHGELSFEESSKIVELLDKRGIKEIGSLTRAVQKFEIAGGGTRN